MKKNKAKFATAFFFKVTPFSVRYKGAHGFHNFWKTVSASDSEPTTNLQAGHESCQQAIGLMLDSPVLTVTCEIDQWENCMSNCRFLLDLAMETYHHSIADLTLMF